jgi:hypothetical protein
MEKSINEQYVSLCARLGDLLFKQEVAEKEIKLIKDQIEALALINKRQQEALQSAPQQSSKN